MHFLLLINKVCLTLVQQHWKWDSNLLWKGCRRYKAQLVSARHKGDFRSPSYDVQTEAFTEPQHIQSSAIHKLFKKRKKKKKTTKSLLRTPLKFSHSFSFPPSVSPSVFSCVKESVTPQQEV